jgi:hypothetical protein
VSPTTRTTIRLDLHRLDLASAADRWYGGSGATLATGSNFGYVTRSSNGSSDLGTSLELSASHDLDRRWNVNGFVSWMRGGRVVSGTFAGDRLWFVYVESVVRFNFGT